MLSKSGPGFGQNLFRAIDSIVFFGVPNHGMDITSLMPIVQDGPNRALVESLANDSQALKEQDEVFSDIVGDDVEIVFFYETLQSPTAIQVRSIRPTQPP